MRRNMFGEMNWLCYLVGHSFVLIGDYPHRAVCERCELNDERLTLLTGSEKKEKKQ